MKKLEWNDIVLSYFLSCFTTIVSLFKKTLYIYCVYILCILGVRYLRTKKGVRSNSQNDMAAFFTNGNKAQESRSRDKKFLVSPPHVPPPKNNRARRQLLKFSSAGAQPKKNIFPSSKGASSTTGRPERPRTASGDRPAASFYLNTAAAARVSPESTRTTGSTSARRTTASSRLPPRPQTARETRGLESSGASTFSRASYCHGIGIGRSMGLASASSSGYSTKSVADGLISSSTRSDTLLNILTRSDAKEAKDIDILSSAESGDIVGVMKVLKSGAHPDKSQGLNGYRPLHHAANRGHLPVAERLIHFGSNINAKTSDGETPLVLATYKGYLNIVELLLDKGADANLPNTLGDTALFYAARQGYSSVVRLLLERGADSTAKNRFGDTAMDDCDDARTLEAFSQAKLVKPTTGGPAKCLVGHLLLHVMSFMAPRTLCRAAQVNGRWHGKASHASLWKALGVSRWQMAMRTSLPELTGGFNMAPFMASYRPSFGKRQGGPSGSRPSSSSSSRSGTRSRPTSSGSTGSVKENLEAGYEGKVAGSRFQAKEEDDTTEREVRHVAGFSSNFF